MDKKIIQPLQDRTNAKLRYAQIHIDELRQMEQLNGSDFDRAHQESFLFHLMGAKDAFLIELNLYYGTNLSNRNLSAGKITQALKEYDRASPELLELHNLEKDKSSWYFHAKEMRDYLTHVSAVSRHYHLGGPYHQQVWLSNPNTGQPIKQHFVNEFDNWMSNMKNLLDRLRFSAIQNNK